MCIQIVRIDTRENVASPAIPPGSVILLIVKYSFLRHLAYSESSGDSGSAAGRVLHAVHLLLSRNICRATGNGLRAERLMYRWIATCLADRSFIKVNFLVKVLKPMVLVFIPGTFTSLAGILTHRNFDRIPGFSYSKRTSLANHLPASQLSGSALNIAEPKMG